MERKFAPWSETEKSHLLKEMKGKIALLQKTVKKIEAGQDVNKVLVWFRDETFKRMNPLEQAMHVAETHPNARASIVMAVNK